MTNVVILMIALQIAGVEPYYKEIEVGTMERCEAARAWLEREYEKLGILPTEYATACIVEKEFV